jgi:hypothetical protein
MINKDQQHLKNELLEVSFIIKRISTSPTYTAGLAVANTTIPGVNDTTNLC